MDENENDIEEFWDRLSKEGEYKNSKGVQFEQLTGSEIYVNSKWPNFREKTDLFQLDLGGYFESTRKLSDALELRSKYDMEQLSPENMVDHFRKGNIHLVCMTFNGIFTGSLTFSVAENMLQAYNHQDDVNIQIDRIFETPDQYCDFTSDYFAKRPPAENIDDPELKN